MDLSRVIRRAVILVALPIAMVLAVLAVAVGVQSGPTASAAQARTELGVAVTRAATAAGVSVHTTVERDQRGACTWFGLAATSSTGMVSPELQVEGPLAPGADPAGTLGRVAGRLTGAGWTVTTTSGGGLVAIGPGGHRLDVVLDAATVRITGQAPCVWPDGERKPAE